MKHNFDSINANRERVTRGIEDALIQREVRLAKDIQSQTGCTWGEAIRAAYRSIHEDDVVEVLENLP